MAFEFLQIVKQLEDWHQHTIDSHNTLIKEKEGEIEMLKLENTNLVNSIKDLYGKLDRLKNIVADKQKEINTLIRDMM